MLSITKNITIPEDEIELLAIRAQGAGGQNVNKVSTAIHLRFDINASSLPQVIKQRLLRLRDKRISKEGVVVIKAQQYRTQEKNRHDALDRLTEIIKRTTAERKTRRPTQPTKRSKKKRLARKTHRSKLKKLRGNVSDEW